MKRLLATAGAVALLAWTVLGLLAWGNVARHVTLTFAEDRPDDARERESSALADELAALHQDVRALAKALGENLPALRDELAARQDESATNLAARLDALRTELESRPALPAPEGMAELLAELRTSRGDAPAPAVDSAAKAVPVDPPPAAAALPEPLAESSAPAAPPASAPTAAQPAVPAAPARRASFLAFTLPSDDFRFDERRSWALLPALSRVGFDGKSTLHDFSGTTSSVAGELEVDLARPAESPRLGLRVEAASLVTGDGGRDEAMREHLAVAEHPALEFELTRFEPGDVDVAAERGTGRALGRMTIRGVTREVAMAVRYSLDDARRLCVEGEMPIALPEFEVPVPNKLGLITMQDEVKVWISLRLRVNPRTRS